MNSLALKKLKHNRFNNISLILIVSFLLIRFFSEEKHFLEHDEVNSINLYTDIRSVFVKNVPNNHVLSSFFGFFINNLFGVDVKYLRLLSFVSFILIIIIFYLLARNIYSIFILLLIYQLSPILITYSVLFRGYYIQALLLIIIFSIFISEKIEFRSKIKIIFLLSNILIIHIISSLYLLIPIIMVLLYLLFISNNINLSNKIKLILLYLVTPFFVLHIVIFFVTTLFNNRITSLVNFIEFINDSQQGVFSNIFYVFSQIYFNTWVVDSPLTTKSLIIFSTNNITLAIIFILALLKSIYKLYKDPQPIDFVIFLSFVTFIAINKSPFDRIFTGLVYFFIFYLFYDLEKERYFSPLAYAGKGMILVGVVLTILNINFFKNFFLYEEKELYIKQNFDTCNLTFEPRDEMDKQIFYYLHLHDCNKKPDIVEFYNFYTTQ